MDKLPHETNAEYCKRVAETVDKDALIYGLMEVLYECSSPRTLNASVQLATRCGSGVSAALIEKYYPRGNE